MTGFGEAGCGEAGAFLRVLFVDAQAPYQATRLTKFQGCGQDSPVVQCDAAPGDLAEGLSNAMNRPEDPVSESGPSELGSLLNIRVGPD
jgi:hypothetical protein